MENFPQRIFWELLPFPTFDGGRGGAAEFGEFLPEHGPQLLVQLGVVEEGGQVPVWDGTGISRGWE